jgi:hypothetical protein
MKLQSQSRLVQVSSVPGSIAMFGSVVIGFYLRRFPGFWLTGHSRVGPGVKFPEVLTTGVIENLNGTLGVSFGDVNGNDHLSGI